MTQGTTPMKKHKLLIAVMWGHGGLVSDDAR
jgi:hypothetical protein